MFLKMYHLLLQYGMSKENYFRIIVATNAMGMGADLKGPSNNVLFHPHRSMLVWIRLVIHSSINNLITNGAHVGIWRFSCWRDLKISNFDL